jgi:bifunctional non-homologous end joining protein LigD
MLSRSHPAPSAGFIDPCLPSSAEHPPSGPGWIHEIKHDGYRLMAHRDAAGVRLLTRNGHDWAARFPLIVEAVIALKAGSCLIDGEAVVCDDNGMAEFAKLRQRRNDRHVVLYAFDLLELDGQDLRREPLVRRKVLLAKLLARARVHPDSEPRRNDGPDRIDRDWSAHCRYLVSAKNCIFRSRLASRSISAS